MGTGSGMGVTGDINLMENGDWVEEEETGSEEGESDILGLRTRIREKQ